MAEDFQVVEKRGSAIPAGSLLAKLTEVSKTWRAAVVDYSKRNNLLFFKESARTIALHLDDPVNFRSAIDGREFNLLDLIVGGEEQKERASKAARNLHARQKMFLEELGVSPIFIALGFSSWNDSMHSGASSEERITRAPIALLQVEIQAQKSAARPWLVRPVRDLQWNGVLLHAASEAGVDLEKTDALGSVEGCSSLAEAIQILRSACQPLSKLDQFEVTEDVFLSQFSFQDEAIWRDLSDVDFLAESELVRALAGDTAAATAIRSYEALSVDDFDYQSPDLENLILDADASQLSVIKSAIAGQSIVVEGPPGTGKSQTISNLLAEILASGKTALFVAQKRAAITAVMDRLEKSGLRDLILDVHETPRGTQVAEQIQSSYENMRRASRMDRSDNLHDLETSRRALVDYRDAFREKGRAFGLSLMELMNLLPGGSQSSAPKWRPSAETLQDLDLEDLRTARGAVEKLAVSGALRSDFRSSSQTWAIDRVKSQDDLLRAQNAYAEISGQPSADVRALINHDRVIAKYGLLNTLTGVNELLIVLSNWPVVQRFKRLLAKNLAVDEINKWIEVLKGEASQVPFAERMRIRLWISMFISANSESAIHVLEAMSNLSSAQIWDGSDPDLEGVIEFEAVNRALVSLEELARFTQGLDFDEISFDEFVHHTERLSFDPYQANLIEFHLAEAELMELGLDGVTEALSEGSGFPVSDPDGALRAFDSYVSHEAVRHALATDKRLRGISGDQLKRFTERFQESDRRHLAENPQKIRRIVAEHFNSVRNQFPSEDSFIQSEAQRKRAHKSVRTLALRAPNLMLGANPIWAMSPIQVASYLPRNVKFDYVIFDEASQIKPEMAIPAIVRGRTAIVAGDSNQLPPTNFFSSSSAEMEIAFGVTDDAEATDEEFVESSVIDSESILEAMERIVGNQKRRLLWHYRSRDERLIALSNIEIYGSSLTTFPASDSPDALRHVLVTTGKHKSVASGSNNNEIEATIELIREHITKRPEESLGVITFGMTHLRPLELAIHEFFRTNADAAAWNESQNGNEPFFVKNLERVQGDERDAIIIATGYGKDVDGRMNLRWGPLVSEWGRRRLNVAITRAKKRMTLVTSFSLAELEKRDIKENTGIALFRQFLEFVEKDGAGYSNSKSVEPLNAFELDILKGLERAGLNVEAQHGVCGYRIDFAIKHPKRPGEYVLAIEADGASYHSSSLARERDRLRQFLLEDRGWTFHRIWSTDWFRDREGQIQLAVQAYEKALKNHGKTPAKKEPTVEPVPHAPVVRERGKPPSFRGRTKIDDFSKSEIDGVVEWVISDGLLRTRAEILEEARSVMGFQRSGARINRRIEEAILRVAPNAF